MPYVYGRIIIIGMMLVICMVLVQACLGDLSFPALPDTPSAPAECTNLTGC